MRAVADLSSVEVVRELDLGALQLAAQAIHTSCVLGMTANEAARRAKEILRSGSSSQVARKIASEVIFLTTPVLQGSDMLPDLPESNTAPQTVVDLVLSRGFQQSIDAFRTCPRKGESRDTAFERVFSRQLAASTGVEVMDRYFASNLVRDGAYSAESWFLKRARHSGVRRLTVRTTEPDGDRLDSFIDRLFEQLGAGGWQHADVFVCGKYQSVHDRFLKFNFGGKRGFEGVSLGGGLDAFRDTILAGPIQTLTMPHDDVSHFEEVFLAFQPRHFKYGTQAQL